MIEYNIEMYDFEHSTNEDRYIALGVVGDVLFVVYTERKWKFDNEKNKSLDGSIYFEFESDINPELFVSNEY